MVDRFGDLNPFVDSDEVESADSPTQLDSFFSQVSVIKEHLSVLRDNVDAIRALTAARLV